MCSIREITILAAGLLYCAAAIADDQDAGVEDAATDTGAARDAAPGVTRELDTRYLDALNNGPYYSTRWPSPSSL